MNEEEGWRPAITIKQMLLGIQDLLDTPNPNSPANSEAAQLWNENRREFNRRVTLIVEESIAVVEDEDSDEGAGGRVEAKLD